MEHVAGGGADIWLIINDPELGSHTYQNWLAINQDNYLTCGT
jgi:hypothetical protein